MLTPEQVAKLEAAAIERGVDPVALRAAAEGVAGGADVSDGKSTDQGPKLYMYLLPFVKVREVRQIFLGLSDSFPGDDDIASDWASAHPLVGAKAEPVSGEGP